VTTYYDVPADQLIVGLSERLHAFDAIIPPEWSAHVKTGSHRERPPTQGDWWHTRAASMLRKVAKKGPIGANRIAQEYGGSKDRGVKKNKAVSGSRNISRKILQQLVESGLVDNSLNAAGTVNFGKVLTPAGHSLLDDVAHSVRNRSEERYPELKRY
jgi:small subunit ribosomal protein S19e